MRKPAIVLLAAMAIPVIGIAACASSGNAKTAYSEKATQTAKWDAVALAEVTGYVQSQKTTGFIVIAEKTNTSMAPIMTPTRNFGFIGLMSRTSTKSRIVASFTGA